MGELSGKVAVVTGGSRNIGRAIALDLAAGGAAVVIGARISREAAEETVAAIAQAGGRAAYRLGDVTDPAAVEALVGEAVARYGGLDIVVNNASVRYETPFAELSFAQWREVTGVILDAAFLLTKAALPHLRAGGAVINIGGLSAFSGAKNRADAVAAKAGLVGLTRALAHELAERDVTANCVVPGLIDTVRERTSPKVSHHHQARTNLAGRWGRPEEVAALVRYLAGPNARYITGQSVQVNGGAFPG